MCEKRLYKYNCQFLATHKKSVVEGCTAFKSESDLKREVAREIFGEINTIKKEYASGDIDGNELYIRLYMLEKKYTEPVHCKDCKHLMFSDCYGECAKGYKGIVNPDDTCEHGAWGN